MVLTEYNHRVKKSNFKNVAVGFLVTLEVRHTVVPRRKQKRGEEGKFITGYEEVEMVTPRRYSAVTSNRYTMKPVNGAPTSNPPPLFSRLKTANYGNNKNKLQITPHRKIVHLNRMKIIARPGRQQVPHTITMLLHNGSNLKNILFQRIKTDKYPKTTPM